MLILSKSDTQEKINLDQPRFAIGRDPSNDLVLEDGRVSGFHATIFEENSKVEIVDQGSSNGTYVNGNRITGRVKLKAWDTLVIGDTSFEVVDSSGRRPTMVQPAVSVDAPVKESPGGQLLAQLKLMSAGEYPAEVAVYGNMTIGRNSDNDLSLNSSMVSGNHARLETGSQSLEIVDLESTNGTWVNGGRVTRKPLSHGDRIAFDEIEYEISLPGGRSNKTQVNPAIRDVGNATTVNPAIQKRQESRFSGQPETTNTVEAQEPVSATVVVEQVSGDAQSRSEPPPSPQVSKDNQSASDSKADGSASRPSADDTVVLPKQEVQPPPQMVPPAYDTTEQAKRSSFTGRGLSFTGTPLQFLGRLALMAVATLFIIPTAWGVVPFFRWVVENARFSDNTTAVFVGKATSVWWIFALIIFVGFLPSFITTSDASLNLLITYGGPIILLPFTSVLWLMILRWVFSSIKLSCGTRLHFHGQYAPFLGWYALNYVSIFTIIGWAWVAAGYFRWLFGQVEGGGQQVVFHGRGHEFLWRGGLLFISSLFIIPIPWVSVWFIRWFTNQLEVV